MNRIEMRNYYRKCAGYLGMMGNSDVYPVLPCHLHF